MRNGLLACNAQGTGRGTRSRFRHASPYESGFDVFESSLGNGLQVAAKWRRQMFEGCLNGFAILRRQRRSLLRVCTVHAY